MIHLEINQNTGITEQLSDGSVVGKLYQLAHGGLLDSTSNVVGNIAVPATYENYISYLTGQGGYFPNLYITATTIYISFADPEVVSVLTNYNILPANGGITAAQAASIGISGGAQGDPFYNNDSIETFDEFKYFRYALLRNCDNLISVDVTGITNLANWAFGGCKNLTHFHGINGVLNTLNLENLATLGSSGIGCFNNCLGLKYITSLGYVSEINGMFVSCSNLETVHLETTTVKITGNCFIDCVKLHTINLSHVTELSGAQTFSNDSDLEYCDGPNSTQGELYLPNLTGVLGNRIFSGCSKLTSVTSLGAITEIQYRAFENCTNLATINIPSSVNVIGDNAFTGTAWLADTTINPNNAPVIVGNGVLYLYKGAIVGSYTVPSGVKNITKWAFQNQTGLTDITLPSSLTDIGIQAFEGCTSLSSIVVDSNNAVLDSRNNCNAVINTSTNELLLGCDSTIIPNTVTKLADNSFGGITTNKVIPDSVTSIGTAFANSGITSIVVPNGVTSLPREAFGGCNLLTYIDLGTGITSLGRQLGVKYCTTFICRAVTPPTCANADTFYLFNNGGNAYIYVPDASIDAYKTANVWKNWESRIKGLSELPT